MTDRRYGDKVTLGTTMSVTNEINKRIIAGMRIIADKQDRSMSYVVRMSMSRLIRNYGDTKEERDEFRREIDAAVELVNAAEAIKDGQA